MITFCAPASRCLAASSRFVKKPVDSITTSTPRSPQGSAAGSFSANTLSSLPSKRIASSVASTSPGNGPRIESYLSRWASVPVSVMSLTPTQSMSAPFACAALNTFLPIRPKPLIPALTDIRPSFRLSGSPSGSAIYQRGECPPGRCGKRWSGTPRGLVHVAVHHVDEQVIALAVYVGEVLRDDHGAVPSTGTADANREVGLAFSGVRRQQVVEQRHEPVVELDNAVRVVHVVHHRTVLAGELTQVGFVVRVGQEADVEGEVGLARGAVLETVGEEGDRELALGLGREHLVGDHLAQPVG